MKITRNNIVLDLTPGTEVPMTLANPLFNDTGSFSYPFETPATAKTLAALGFPERPDRYERYVNKSPATLEHGLLQLSGTHNISSVDLDSGTVTHDFIADEAAFYEEIGDRMLSEVMSGKVDPLPDGVDINERYRILHHFLTLANTYAVDPARTLDYDYIAPPVCVAMESIDGGYNYIFLNKTDPFGNIVLDVDTATLAVNPNGITPFLFVRTVIRNIFRHYGFTVQSNPFVEDAELQQAFVPNNTVDALILGFIDYADLAPSVTVNTFIRGVEAQFGCKFFYNYRLRTVDIKMIDPIFSADPAKDFSAKLASPVKLGYSEPQKLVLTVGRSFSRAAVIGDNYKQVAKETAAAQVNLKVEEGWLYTAAQFVRNVIHAYNRFNFYVSELKYEIEQWDRYGYKFLCSPFWDYKSAENITEFPVENPAEAVNNLCAQDISTAYQFVDVPFFEANTRRRHPYDLPDFIPLVDGYDNDDCPLAFLICRGWVTANYTMNPLYEPRADIRYLFASSFTAHPVATIEGPGRFHRINLDPTSIAKMFYKHYEDFLRRSDIQADCVINFDAVDINNIKWWEKIWLKDQPYFIDKINLTLRGNSEIRIDSVQLRTARLYGAPIKDIYLFAAAPLTIDAPVDGGEYRIAIESTHDGDWTDYTVLKSESWFRLVFVGSPRLQLTVLKNDVAHATPRTGTVILRQFDSTQPDITITVNQPA